MHITLYIIAFLEGFTTLSVEIMAIRNSIAIIGSNAIATSIILGIILLALSYGYYRGGIYASQHPKERIRKKIYWNLIIASVFYTFVSFPFENMVLKYLLDFDIGYFIPVFTAISLLFILPVFLASQTIPLLSELIDHDQKAIIIGKLLFYSTIGSFLGSVMTSLVFFSYFGVEKSIVLNGLILAILALLVLFQFQKKDRSRMRDFLHIAYIGFLVLLLFGNLSSIGASPDRVFSHNSAYNDIEIFDRGSTRLFTMNGSYSSGLDVALGKSFFPYIQEITRIIDEQKPKRVLVIGAAGFTLPQDIAKRGFIEQVDVCDIDGSLDVIAEKYFLKESLHPKIQFYKESARYFIQNKIRSGEKYDFIFLDAYSGRISIPSELLTKDFFQKVLRLSNGTIAMNLILDRDRSSTFSMKLENTLSSAIPGVFIRGMTPGVESYFDNFIAINNDISGYSPIRSNPLIDLYTDDKNTLEYDKYQLFYTQKLN